LNSTYTLIRLAQNGDKNSESRLVSENLALVHSCAGRLMRDGCEYEDLIQIGSIALIKAIRRFDVSYNVRFSTYAVPIIVGDIKRYIRDNTTVKVSRSLKEIFSRISVVRNELSIRLMREPTLGEISSESGYTTEKLIAALEACSPCESLEKNLKSDSSDNISLGDILKSDTDMNTELDRIALKNAINMLGERERKIIIMRCFRGKTQNEVSAVLGVSQVQISRLEKKALGILHEHIK